MNKFVVVLFLCFSALGQTVSSGRGLSSGFSSRSAQNGGTAQGENGYCPAGTGTEMTKGIPTWGSSDGVASLLNTDPLTGGPGGCMNTALSSTPSPGSTIAVNYTGNQSTDAAALQNAFNTVACGQTITLPAGSTYTGVFTVPYNSCDGGHWITVRTTGTSNGNFPAEHSQATPCLAGISNDATNGYNAPGYPTYSCPSYPTVLTAKIQTGTSNQAALNFGAVTDPYGTSASHYRFIGIEITKVPDTHEGQLISMSPCNYAGQIVGGQTCTNPQGAQFVIFDRSLIHGQPWNSATMGADTNSETQSGIGAGNSQYVALINSWDYDTYCVSGCVDSQAFNGGTGSIQDGPFKLYGNVLASAGETFIFGGGGVGPLTPTTQGVEVRANVLMKPLAWMVPITTSGHVPTVKNLGELKNGAYAIIEGNTILNNWQGQSDQLGYALLIDPKSQNNKSSVQVTFDGTDGLVTATSGNFTNGCGGGNYCNPCGGVGSTQAAAAAAACVPANCPPGGCILEIQQSTRLDYQTAYRFCDGANGCDQSGQDLLTHARILPYAGAYPPSGSGVSTYSCVPGLCPSCKVHDIVVRYNNIQNVTNGIATATGKASHCQDQSAGAYNFEIHDNDFEGLSTEMANATQPYELSAAVTALNGQVGTSNQILSNVEIAHNTCAIDLNNNQGLGGFGYQWDNTDIEYLAAFNVHDNVSVAPWHVLHSQGSLMGSGSGVGGQGGLANTYQTNACAATYPTDANGDVVGGVAINPVSGGTAFTFSPALPSYFVTKNGQYTAINSSTSTGFTLTASLAAGDSFTVRDLNTCNWTFQGNLFGEGLAGSGKPEDPYPASNANACGTSGTAACILSSSAFTGIFSNWQTRGAANYTITSLTYKGSATDASARAAAGKSADPGADQGVLTNLTSGSTPTIFYYPLSINSTSISFSPPYNTMLTTPAYGTSGGGASPYKSWWITSAPSPAGSGLILGRDGTLGGPFYVLTVSRTSGVSTFNPKMQLDPAAVPAVGQTIVLTNFANGSGTQANDASFNGTCTISAFNGNGSVSCNQAGADVSSHTPSWSAGSDITFNPTPGTYIVGVSAKDGAFQQANAQISITVN